MAGDKQERRASISHVIFDMDGLLIDTERIYTKIMDAICSKYGKQFTFGLKVKMMGRSGAVAAQIAIDDLALPITVDEYLSSAQALKEEWFGQCELLPGAEKLVRHLHTCKVPIAVASGSYERDYLIKSQRHKELFNLFRHFVFGDDKDVKNSKPSPDVFLAAASRFGDEDLLAENVLVFEDAPNGVTAGKAAGMHVVMVPDERLERSLCEPADLVLKSLEEFDPLAWGLPPYPA